MVLEQLKNSVKNAKTGFKEKSLLRFEFVELIIRMALKKYSTEGQGKDKIEKFMENNILPIFQSAEYVYEGYRYEKIHTVTMNNLLQHWIEQIKRQFSELKPSETGYVTLKSVSGFLNSKKVHLIDADVLKCFALSKMLIIDELSDENYSKFCIVCFVLTLCKFLFRRLF